MELLIEVIAGASPVNEVRNKETREIVALKQTVYAHIPNSAFPVQCQIRVNTALQPGKYSMKPVFKTGRFGDLEIDPFTSPDVVLARPDQVKASS